MDRQFNYDGQIPQTLDLLNTNRNTLVGLGLLTLDVLGQGTLASGLPCTQTSPTSLNVQVGAGRIYQYSTVDATSYGDLPADTTDFIIKQGILSQTNAPVVLSCPAPSTSGFSINYLIEATYADSDTAATVLPYYNASDPSSPFNGPGNTGATNSTKRQGLITLIAKVGAAAITGTQTTPAVDSGCVGLYVVTVANGQTAITNANISLATNAPFITETLTQKISAATGRTLFAPITAPHDDIFTATSGQTVFTLGATPAGLHFMQVSINGAMVRPGTDFNVSGNTLTLTSGATTGQQVLAHSAVAVLSIVPGAASIVDSMLSPSSLLYSIEQRWALLATETSLGITVVDSSYQPATVERYGSDLTNMTTAWNAAVKLGIFLGTEVTYGSAGQHTVNGAINCTYGGAGNQNALVIRNVGNAGLEGYKGTPPLLLSIIAQHNDSAVFDFTGRSAVRLYNVTIGTKSGFAPITGLLTARNQFRGSLQFYAEGCHVVGTFLCSPFYNYGSENDCLFNCIWGNFASTGSTKTRVYTSTNNIFNIASAFSTDPFGNAVSIASGAISCIGHDAYSNQDFNFSSSSEGTTDCIYFDAISLYRSFCGWVDCAGAVACPTNPNPGTGGGVIGAYAVAGTMTVSLLSGTFTGAYAAGMQIYGTNVPVGTAILPFGTGGTTGTGGVGTYAVTPSASWASSGAPTPISAGFPGRALIAVDLTNNVSDWCVIHGLIGENSGPLVRYGIAFINPSATNVHVIGWDIQACRIPAAGYAITSLGTGAANVVFDSGNISNIAQGGNGYGCSWPGTVLASRIDSTIPWNINILTNCQITGDLVNQISITDVNGSDLDHTGAQPTFTGGIVTGSNGWTFSSGTPTIHGQYNWIRNEIDFTLTISPNTQVATTANATFSAPGTSTALIACEVVDETTGTLLQMAIWNGATITLKAAIAITNHVLIIKGRGAVS